MLKRVVTALCCGLSFMVSAAQVTDLYQGKAPTSGDMAAAQSQALGEVLQEKPVQQLMHDWVLEPQHSQPHELEQLRQADIAKWRPILAASGFVAD